MLPLLSTSLFFCRALSVAVAALSVLKPQQAQFVLLRTKSSHGSNKRQYSATLGDDEEKLSDTIGPSYDHLLMRTAQQLSVSLQLRSALSKINESGIRGGRESTALHLAISLDELEVNDRLAIEAEGLNPYDIINSCLPERESRGSTSVSSSSASSFKSTVISAIGSAASLHQHTTASSSSSSSSSTDHRLHSQYSPQGGRGLTQCQASSLQHPWTPLLEALAFLDTASTNWTLHRAAFEGILAERTVGLPSALISSYRSVGGDEAALLRILLAHGHLLEACYLATRLIQSHTEQSSSHQGRVIGKGNKIIPYKTIDELIISSRKYFSLISYNSITSDEEKREYDQANNWLKSQVSQLENALKMHFVSVLSAEITSGVLYK